MSNRISNLRIRETIAWKMVLGISGILVLVVGVLLAFFIYTQGQKMEQGVRQKVTTIANTLSWMLVTSVDTAEATMNTEPIQQIIESAQQDADLIGVRVEGSMGQRLAGFEDKDLPEIEPLPPEDPTIIVDDLLHMAMEIRKESNPVGVLRMSYSLTSLNAEKKEVRWIGLLLGFVFLVLGVLLAYFFGRGVGGPLSRMTATFRRMAEGDLNQRQLADTTKGEMGMLAGAFNELLRQLKEFSQHAQSISQGDLARVIQTRGDLADAFENMTTSIKEITSTFNELSSKMDKRTSEILSTAKQQEAGAAEQAATVSEVTSTMEELAATARQISQNAESVTRSAEEANQAVEDGRDSLFAFVQSMHSIEMGNKTINDNIVALNRHVQQIRGIIDLINDIADRTDLLALNAALEGTKAGEAGKGFLLVAAEMRRLAENVFSSTAEIKQLISEVTEATNATVMANESGMRATQEGTDRAGEAERAFGRVVETIEATSKAARQISLATQQQHAGTDQVVEAMGEVSTVAQQGVEGIRATTQAVGELSATASQLKQLVSKYRG